MRAPCAEASAPTIEECFDMMADVHMAVFGMKNSPTRNRVWTVMKAELVKLHDRST